MVAFNRINAEDYISSLKNIYYVKALIIKPFHNIVIST